MWGSQNRGSLRSPGAEPWCCLRAGIGGGEQCGSGDRRRESRGAPEVRPEPAGGRWSKKGRGRWRAEPEAERGPGGQRRKRRGPRGRDRQSRSAGTGSPAGTKAALPELGRRELLVDVSVTSVKSFAG